MRELGKVRIGGFPGEALGGPDFLGGRAGLGVVERGGGDVLEAGAVGAGIGQRGPARRAKAALDARRGGVDGERPLHDLDLILIEDRPGQRRAAGGAPAGLAMAKRGGARRAGDAIAD